MTQMAKFGKQGHKGKILKCNTVCKLNKSHNSNNYKNFYEVCLIHN